MPDSQKTKILEYLKRGKKLTVLKAIKLFGCYALSQRVGELKREGHPIESKIIEVGSGKRVAEYKLNTEDYTLNLNI
jgi:hypothetical protein